MCSCLLEIKMCVGQHDMICIDDFWSCVEAQYAYAKFCDYTYLPIYYEVLLPSWKSSQSHISMIYLYISQKVTDLWNLKLGI